MQLTDIRTKIDAIDDELLRLINERMKLVQEVGIIKHSAGESIYRPEREKAILTRLKAQNEANKGLLWPDAIEAIFLELFAVSRNLEKAENVAFLGPVGSFTHQAAESRFGSVAEYLPLGTIGAVFRSVETGQAKFGVVPLENNIDGVVSESIDLLGKSSLKIVAELSIKIHHCLASAAPHLNDIKRIYSKDIAYNQCRRFIEDHGLENVEFIPVASTAKAAQLASDEPNSAAICSGIAAKLNNLPILFENIEDSDRNETRFIILSNFKNASSGHDKTSALVQLPDKPGSLAKFLGVFKKAGINLTKIESRPAKDAGFSYIFYIDFEGHIDDETVQKALESARYGFKWLGSYSRSI